MIVEIHEPIGSGALGRVFRATDDLDRTVAVKLLSLSAEQVSTAREHARALARVSHPNIVHVHGVEPVADPETGEQVQGIVMEYIQGENLYQRAAGPPMDVGEVRQVGLGVLSAVKALHEAGVAHQDLHPGNVMVCGLGAKVIDVMYRGTLRQLPSVSRAASLAQDLSDLRIVLRHLIRHSELGILASDEFAVVAARTVDFDEIEAAFAAAVEQRDREGEIRLQVDSAFADFTRVTRAGFVEGERFGRALSDQIPREAVAPLLQRIIEENAGTEKHRYFIRALWERMTEAERHAVALVLGNVIDAQIPGNYGPPLFVLVGIGADGWRRLRVTTQMQMEEQILADIRQGRTNAWRGPVPLKGNLGTFVYSFWRYFDRDRLVRVFSEQLQHHDWDAQNYIGEKYMQLLPALGDTPARRKTLIDALKSGLRTDPKVVKNNLRRLPADWLAELQEESADAVNLV